ncbi:MAG: hypothetical protein JO033_27945 [Acidobacteriaceae bacterium]|nr:hypothetical protein [Acidobacteriaceae bacterium]MBV9500320.1 hypothetical protein [Acidobacteriaceae bacterium]
MPTFPLLSSGAVAQYSLPVLTGQAVQTIRFLDGADQRYLIQGRTFRQWEIRLTLLTDSEIAQLQTFFTEQQGDYTKFDFPDPLSGQMIPNCRLLIPEMTCSYEGVGASSTLLYVTETNG